MAVEVYMPQLGQTMTQGTVIRWHKAEGDPVRQGEPLLTIETDKVTTEVDAPASGVLGSILVAAGTAVPIGQVIAYLLSSGEQDPGRARRDAPDQPGQDTLPHTAASEPLLAWRASPLAKRLANEMGIELATVQGTGPDGRIVADDVRDAAQRVPPPMPLAKPVSPAHQPPDLDHGVVPLSGTRRVIAERMTASFTSTPHFYLTTEIDATALVALRERLLPRYRDAFGDHLTITDALIKIVAQALRECPEINVAWATTRQGTSGGLRIQSQVNVGVAVATSEGLVVPVIRRADKLSLPEIVRCRSDLTQRAREGKLTLADLEEGTFTLSNLGMFAVDQFQAIINPSQSAILAVGRIKERAVAIAGSLAIRPTLFATLSADHRLLDGAQAARFLGRVAEIIAEPYFLI